MVSLTDTIVAIATASGRGALGIVRISGPLVPAVANAIVGRLPAPRVAQLCAFRADGGVALDEGLAVYFPAPASFTGEHVLELQGHGGPMVLDAIVQRLLDLGCRAARPGEFSERAYLNGKIDVAQAEAIADLIDAGSAAAARAAVRSMQGDFSREIDALQALLSEMRAFVEADIDFPDEEINELPEAAFVERAQRLFAAFDAITDIARQGTLLRDGVSVVITGKPNAGKSSLLNRLVGDAVAIVNGRPGTTRDVLRYKIHLDGLPITLIDTAGLRESEDAIEVEGMRRAEREIASADRVLYLIDATVEGTDILPPELSSARAVTRVFNKVDIAFNRAREIDAHYISARTGAGCDELRLHLKQMVGYRDAGEGALSARRRHLDALAKARQRVQCAADAREVDGAATEIIAEELRLAQLALGEITGEFTNDDLLGQIFSSFCIGK